MVFGSTSSIRLFICLLAVASVVEAQWREGFESPDPSWSLSGADGGVRVISHRREFEGAHSGTGVEHARFMAGRGTYIYYSMPIERAPLIEETKVSLWVRGDKTQFQLFVRVVLPHTLDDRTGKPLTTLLRGDEYIEAGAWQQLRVAELPKLMARDLIVLRRQFGSQVDARDAYIDMLVVNAYGCAGETNIWFDDLEVAGVLDPEWAKNIEPSTSSAPGQDSQSTPPNVRPLVIDGNVILIAGRPQFVRAIEERGESWEWLKALGFNTLWLSTSPTAKQQEEAKRLGLWLIAPPPNTRDDPGAMVHTESVIAWLVGRNLGVDDLNATRSLAREIRTADRVWHRPLLCGAKADMWNYSREADILLHESPPLFAATELLDTTQQLRASTAQARTGTPAWSALNLEASPALREQLKLMAPESTLAPQADLTQARQALYALLASGTRGVLFRSTTRCDGNDEFSTQRQAMFTLLNQELELCEPWLAGGTLPQDIPTGDPTLRAVLWQTERSRLLLLSRENPQGQYCSAPVANDAMSFVLPGAPAADRYFHLTADGLRPLTTPANSAGAKITIPEAGHTAAVVVTQNSLVIQHLARTSETQRRLAIETRLRLAANQLTATELTVAQIAGSMRAPPTSAPLLAESQSLLNQADVLLARGDWTGCYRHVRFVEARLQRIRRDWWETARASWTNSLANPLCTSFETLPAYANAALALRERAWGPNALTDGNFEQLDRLLAAGWKQLREESPQLMSHVELSRELPHGGAAALKMSVVSRGDAQLATALQPAVKIVASPLAVRAGQWIRLHGWARVPRTANGASGELMVYDNLTGAELAELLRGSNEWREFNILRVMPADGMLQIHFALRGSGEVFLDDVTLQVSDPHLALSSVPQ